MSLVKEKGEIRCERKRSLIIKSFVNLLFFLREKSHHRPVSDYSKAISFSEAGLPEILFRISVLVPVSKDIQILCSSSR